MEAVTCLAGLLADPCKPARIGAARAIARLGCWEGIPLLQLKILIGDDDPEVLGECCTSLLQLPDNGSIDLVVGLLSSSDPEVRSRAALALGESHLCQAFEPLCACWRSERDLSVRGLILTCIGLLRSNESRQFLLALIVGSDATAAADAIRALAPFAADEGLRDHVDTAIRRSANRRLLTNTSVERWR